MAQEGTKAPTGSNRLRSAHTGFREPSRDALWLCNSQNPLTLTPRLAYAWTRVDRLQQFHRIPAHAVARMAGIESHRSSLTVDGCILSFSLVVARQQGKTTFMKQRILMGLFEWDNKLQIGTAHRLTTSLETFRDLVQTIESNDGLAKQVKRIRWAHGSEEIECLNGNRYMVKAGASAARGISKPSTVHIDETRELKDETTWASLRYTMMAAENPQLWSYSNAGDQHSLVLNQIRERGIGAAGGSTMTSVISNGRAITTRSTIPLNFGQGRQRQIQHSVTPYTSTICEL
jgi:hypothetical protein